MSELREIVLDTETTGLATKDGHRIIEIGCVELINKIKTGNHFHTYVNPQRPVESSAFAIHGISNEFLQDKPMFSSIAYDFVAFIGNSKLVIHNAPFDTQFINHELALLGLPLLSMVKVVDTLVIARKKFPGSPASLDALCKRFNVSLESRTKHGALVDAELLASVYIAMYGVVQNSIALSEQQEWRLDIDKNQNFIKNYQKRSFNISTEELSKHKQLLDKITEPIWDDYNKRKYKID